MELGLVRKIDIDHEMQQAYLDYAMSTIVARALPDARDGLKPVHRRILYAMYDMGLRADSPYKKSARIVGEVLGKYHPHGDASVYEAMARMAQDFSLRTLLVDGQGNFGSVDGDPPAAMRYTEARLTPAALDMLFDLNKNTVAFGPNFDDTLNEPLVLPSAIPNLLVNGATGIAVGMATSIPPHNLGEVVDALVYMLQHWDKLDDIDLDHLMHFIKGPDFPTGGLILQEAGEDSIEAAYGSGKGKVTIQARAHIEEMERGKSRIIVTELPYMVNKASLIERIAELAREGHLEGLADLRDESDRQGMRIVIEMSKNVAAEKILAELYKRTPMQSTFSIILLALVADENGRSEPRMLTLKQALKVYVEHRLTVIKRRAEYDLEKAKARAHILEGYLVALKNLDEIIELIKKSPDVETARERLIKRYKLSEIQANAILEMQLRRLAALERKKIETEYKEVQALIKELESLLKSPVKMRAQAAEELLKVKAAYGDKRRTHIVNLKEGKNKKSVLTTSQLLPEQVVWVGMNAEGLLSRTHDEKPPRPSGSDAPKLLARANSTDTLYLVSERGVAAAVAVHTLPEAEKLADGVPFNKACALKTEDRPVAIFALPMRRSSFSEETCVLTVTRGGMLKKSPVSDLPGPSAQSFALCKVNEGDALGWVSLSDGKKEIFLVTAKGLGIRFPEDDIRPMGLLAAGVNGIKLGVGDVVTGAEVISGLGTDTLSGTSSRTKATDEPDVFLICSDGKAKRVALAEFPSQGRYGKGVITWEVAEGVTLAGLAIGKPTHNITIHLRKAAAKQARLDEAGMKKRATVRGDVVVEVKPGDAVLGVTDGWMVERYLGTMSDEKEEKGKKEPKTRQLTLLKEEKTKKETSKSKTAAAQKPAAGKTTAKETGKTITKKPVADTKPAAKTDSKSAAKPVADTKTTTKTTAKTSAKPVADTKAATKATSKTPTKPAVESKSTKKAAPAPGKTAAGPKKAVAAKKPAVKEPIANAKKQPAGMKKMAAETQSAVKWVKGEKIKARPAPVVKPSPKGASKPASTSPAAKKAATSAKAPAGGVKKTSTTKKTSGNAKSAKKEPGGKTVAMKKLESTTRMVARLKLEKVEPSPQKKTVAARKEPSVSDKQATVTKSKGADMKKTAQATKILAETRPARKTPVQKEPLAGAKKKMLARPAADDDKSPAPGSMAAKIAALKQAQLEAKRAAKAAATTPAPTDSAGTLVTNRAATQPAPASDATLVNPKASPPASTPAPAGTSPIFINPEKELAPDSLAARIAALKQAKQEEKKQAAKAAAANAPTTVPPKTAPTSATAPAGTSPIFINPDKELAPDSLAARVAALKQAKQEEKQPAKAVPATRPASSEAPAVTAAVGKSPQLEEAEKQPAPGSLAAKVAALKQAQLEAKQAAKAAVGGRAPKPAQSPAPAAAKAEAVSAPQPPEGKSAAAADQATVPADSVSLRESLRKIAAKLASSE